MTNILTNQFETNIILIIKHTNLLGTVLKCYVEIFFKNVFNKNPRLKIVSGINIFLEFVP